MGLGRFLRRKGRAIAGAAFGALPIPGAGLVGSAISSSGRRRRIPPPPGLVRAQQPRTMGRGGGALDEFLQRQVGLGGLTAGQQITAGADILGAVIPGFGGLGGIARQVLPGGGAPSVPVTVGGGVPKGSLPITAAPLQKMINTAMPGYTLVRRQRPGGGEVVFQINTAWARDNGFKLPRKQAKPPISAGDWKKLKAAERAKAKAKRVASAAGFTCSPKGRRAPTKRKR